MQPAELACPNLAAEPPNEVPGLSPGTRVDQEEGA
jgi:hypothetical protein